ncbi:MAG: hypothetical protein HOP29_00135 [Phycisphaerales bacterium]|nr:hypothetical protein [Phycisphaerales bacterium]
MKTSKLMSVVAGLMVAGAASAETFTANVVLTGSPNVAPGGSTTLEIRGTLTNESVNSGLCFFAYDTRVTGPRPVNLSTAALIAPGDDVDEFVSPLGYSINFNGTPSGNNLAQMGGGTNTIKNVPNAAPFVPIPNCYPPFNGCNIPLNVGHGGGAELHQITLSLPGDCESGEEYTFQLIPGSLFANYIDSVSGVVPNETYAVNAVETLVIGSSVVLTCGCEDPNMAAPALVHGNGGAGQVQPCSGYRDPRIETTGPDRVVMQFNEPVRGIGGFPVGAESFIPTETGGGAPPVVMAVNQLAPMDGSRYEVVLNRVMTLQQWTTIRATVEDLCGNPITNNGSLGLANEPDRVDIARLPGNVNQDLATQPVDLINFRQAFAGGFAAPCLPATLYFDIDRNATALQPNDLIRFRQILAGTAPATKIWLNQTIPARP